MKKIIAVGMLALVINGIMGCTFDTAVVHSLGKIDTDTVASLNKINNTDPKVIITDLAKWKHPVKEVFKKNHVTLVRVELTNNKTYPTFIVKSLEGISADSSDFLYSLSEKNGYWDFRITDGTRFINVYCDKTKKIITKAESNEKTMDIATIIFPEYNGVWLDVSFANQTGYYSKMNIKFLENNHAHVVLESSTDLTGTAQIVNNIYFDYNQEANFTGIDSFGNTIKAKISLYDGNVSFDYLSNDAYKGKKNIVTVGSGRFVREAEYLNVQKSMKILITKYGFVDNSKGFYIPKYEDESLYFGYEGKTDDGRYRIGVRYCRDTVIYAWYLVDPDTKEVEVENY
ncbi:hypothetical protein [Paenibacillus sp. HW567]|uniref:hypothetical protein n=1 Tax=Paenibacillus sp. HW567 TaxID=1034769 RepID=UPI00036D0D40|nr:hypothetical protein [Paenibacillus sp. HW567]